MLKYKHFNTHTFISQLPHKVGKCRYPHFVHGNTESMKDVCFVSGLFVLRTHALSHYITVSSRVNQEEKKGHRHATQWRRKAYNHLQRIKKFGENTTHNVMTRIIVGVFLLFFLLLILFHVFGIIHFIQFISFLFLCTNRKFVHKKT